MNIIAYIDGSSKGNPGEAGYGLVIRDDSGTILKKIGKYIGHATNNVAEYNGLIGCLEYAQEISAARVEVFSDSELLVNQMNGKYKIKKPHLQILYNKIQNMLDVSNIDLSISHIPREQNNEADGLARQAVDMKSGISV